MKHKKLFRSVTALLAALVLMGGFSVTAFAGGGDVSDEPPTPVTETEPEETTGGYEPQPLTPEGNMSLVDDITGEASGDKQFITVVTKNGNYFYIIIDRAEDGENAFRAGNCRSLPRPCRRFECVFQARPCGALRFHHRRRQRADALRR